MATRTISAAGGNFDATAAWDEGVVPTSVDNIVARGDGTSGNLALNVTAPCRSFNLTNYSATISGAGTLQLFATAAPTDTTKWFFISAATTWTHTGIVQLRATYTTLPLDITTNGKTLGANMITSAGGVGVTYRLLDDLRVATSFTYNVAGTLDMGGKTIYVAGTAATMSSGTLTNPGTLSVSSGGITAALGSMCVGLNVDVTGAGVLTMAPTATLGTLTQAAGTTLILSGNMALATWNLNGNSYGTPFVPVNSSVNGTQRTVTAGAVTATRAQIKDIALAGAVPLPVAVPGGMNLGNNSGWLWPATNVATCGVG